MKVFASSLWLALAVGAVAGTVHVWPESPNPLPPYTNWATAARGLQEAFDAAQSGDTVLATNGVYATGGRPAEGWALSNRVLVTKPIRVQSVNGPGVTLIVGAPALANVPGVTAVRCAYVGGGGMLSGFLLTNGHTQSLATMHCADVDGAGAWCEPDGVLQDCVLTGNHAVPPTGAGHGGGARGGTLRRCTITNNACNFEGGGAYGARVEDCVLNGNHTTDSGGAAAHCELFRCAMTGNWVEGDEGGGGAVYVSTLFDCTLTWNVSYRDGGGAADASCALYNCALVNNSATVGGGARGSTLYNCTVTGNHAGLAGGVAGCDVYNCIVYGNSSQDGWQYYACTFDHSCVSPLPSEGSGNLADDPELASLTHLSARSPCVGRGNPSYAEGVDLDGETWLSPPSIGADQLVPGASTGPLSVALGTDTTNAAVGFPLPFSAQIEGRTTASVWTWGDGSTLSNRPLAQHVWTNPGHYLVRLTAYNDQFPEGLSATTAVCVRDRPVHYVNRANPTPAFPYTSWPTAATVIQEALAAAGPGSTVLVTNGVYDQGATRLTGRLTNRVALVKPLTLTSVNGPAVTHIVGAAPLATDDARGLSAVRCAYVGPNALLSGFTLTNGHTLTDDNGLWEAERSGAGVWCEDGGLVRRCILTGNRAAAGGGGALRGTLQSCLLTGNTATDYGGGAVYASLDHCTVSANASEYRGGGVYACGVRNSIVCHNTAPTQPDCDLTESTVTNSCTFPAPARSALILTNDPAFVDGPNGNYQLRFGSPCLDAGLDAQDLFPVDLAGHPRAVDGEEDGLARSDLGAYEYDPRTADSNGDGIPDGWTRLHGLAPNDPGVGEGDPDHDGQTTFQEWVADTYPTDRDSCLRVVAIAPGPPVRLSFRSSLNRHYTLWVSTNLTGTAAGWHPVSAQTKVAGTGGLLVLFDSESPAPSPRFYRVAAEN